MKKLILIPILFGLTASTWGASARADEFEGEHGQGFGRRALHQLGLSSEQKQKLAEIRKSQKPTLKALREKSKEARDQLRSKLASDASDAELRTAHAALQSVNKELGDARFEHILAMRKVLTVEQRAKFRSMHEQFKNDHKHHE